MAEIHVEKKRGVGAWVWVLLVVALLVAAVVFLWQAGYIDLGSEKIIEETVGIGGGWHGA
jgi:hypothetical protein